MDDRTHIRHRRRSAPVALLALLLMLPFGAVQAAPIVPSTECDVTRDAQGNKIGDDAGDSMATATPLGIPGGCRGSITASTDEQDWYKFEATVGRRIDIKLASEAPLFATDVRIIDAANKVVLNDAGAPLCNDSTPHDVCTWARATLNATLFLVLTREVGSGSYDLTADGTPPHHDCGTPGDAGSEPLGGILEIAKVLLPDEGASAKVREITCSGRFDQTDSIDAFQIYAPLGTVFEFDLSATPRHSVISNVEVLDPGTDPFTCVHPNGSTATWGTHYCKPTVYSGRYTFKLHGGVQRNEGFVDWTMTLRLRHDDCSELGTDGTAGDAPDTVASPAARRQFGGICYGALDARPAKAADPSKVLDAVDALAVSSEAGTLSFTASAFFGNCLKLTVREPGGASKSDTECGPLSNDPPPGAGLASVQLTGAAGIWAVDVERTGFTPGAPSDTPAAGGYVASASGLVPFELDCGTSSDVSTHGVELPARVDADGKVVALRETSCSGDLRTAADTDAYTITGLALTDILTVDLGTTDAAEVCLKDPTGVNRGCGKSLSARADTAALTGAWTATVKSPPPPLDPTPPLSSYTLTIAGLSQGDCGDRDPSSEAATFIDAGNSPATAMQLPQAVSPLDDVTGGPVLEAQTCTPTPNDGALRHVVQDAQDWYSVDLVNQYTALVASMVVESPGNPRDSSDFDLCVIPPGAPMQCSANPPSVPEVVVATPTCPLPQGPQVPSCAGAGTWKVGVIYRSGPLGAYRLAIAGRN